jgi:hypothetical protein
VEVIGSQVKFSRHRGPHRENYEIVKDILLFVASKYNCNMAEVTFGAILSTKEVCKWINIQRTDPDLL